MNTQLLNKASAPLPTLASRGSGSGGTSPRLPRPQPEPEDDDDGEPGFFRKYRVLLGVAGAVAAAAVYVMSGPDRPTAASPMRKVAVPINVTVAPPPLPPPPPPPPKVEPPKEDKMEEETAAVEEPPPEAAPDDSPPPPGTNNVGDGKADGFGLGKASGGNGAGGGRRVGTAGSKYGYYAGQVQSSVSAALRRHAKTRRATISVTARLWADETGRITRATVSGSTGDPAVDAALRNEVLTGLQLQSPPPAGMKMPINLRLSARAPR